MAYTENKNPSNSRRFQNFNGQVFAVKFPKSTKKPAKKSSINFSTQKPIDDKLVEEFTNSDSAKKLAKPESIKSESVKSESVKSESIKNPTEITPVKPPIYSVKKPKSNSKVEAELSKLSESTTWAKNTVLTVITFAMLTMVLFTLYNLIATPEYLIKKEIATIATDYYENYFYPRILYNNSISPAEVASSAGAETALSPILDQYTERGFATVSLQQLLLYDNSRHADSTASLARYCNLDSTNVKIYPESPFSRNDYRAEYSYSCKF